MKIRLGFVSNSSTTSFLIYGAYLTTKELDELTDSLPTLLEKNYSYDEDGYLGRSWDTVKDDETGKQFKESVEKEVKKLFPNKKLEFRTVKEAYRDG